MRNSEISVSVIVPIYNAGVYLQDCINSLLSQSLENIEFIFVLDKPVDGSDEYIKKIASKNERVTVIENVENIHIGESRNRGLEIARGEYIGFIDQDDFCDHTMYDLLYNKAKRTNADISMCVPFYLNEKTRKQDAFFYPQDDIDVLKVKIQEMIIGDSKDSDPRYSFYKSHGVIWDKIYKRELLVKFNIKFQDTRVVTYEDNLFLLECLLASSKIAVINKPLYTHRLEVGNTAASYWYSKFSKVKEYLDVLEHLLRRYNVFDKYYDRFSRSVISYVVFSLSVEYYYCQKISYVLRLMREIFACPIIVNAFEYLSLKEIQALFPNKGGKLKAMFLAIMIKYGRKNYN